MKSYFLMMSVVLWVFCFVNVNEKQLCAEQAPNQTVSQEEQGLVIEKGQKAQVIFYSRTGRTRNVAETIKDILDCDMLEINDLKDRSGIMGFISGMIDVRKNPTTKISPESVNIEDYDLLFIGSPIWGMKFAPAITTFLDSTTNFKGKKVVLFVTTSSRIKQSAFNEYSEIIHKKGGEVIGNFFVKTLWKDSNEIKEEAKEIIIENKGKWMKRVEKRE